MENDFTLWLTKAKESLDDALYSFESHRYGLTAFCCQQALEKLLKAAVIKLKKERPRKIHDLLPLLRDSGLEISEEHTTEIAKISKFYFLVRYPDINKQFFTTPEVAKNTLEKTKEIFPWIKNKLKKS
jgi:HEPN domain-containing protein